MTTWEVDLNNSLNTLSVAEQEAIRNVLEKDLEFQHGEQQRIRSLSNTVQIKKLSVDEKRRASSVAGSTSSESGLSSPGNLSHGRTSPLPKWNSKQCTMCSATLGYILNSGTKCKKCQTPLCNKCTFVVDSANGQKLSLCSVCHSERELSAVKNEWVKGSDEQTSEKLLNVMRSTEKRNNSFTVPKSAESNRGGRAPYKRNLTLPAIQTNFLIVPNEENGSQTAEINQSPKFWGGSPSPRSPRSFSSANSSISNVCDTTPSTEGLRAIHPREPIGSPAPRPMSSTPLCNVPEDDTKLDTAAIERRRSAFEGSRRSGKLRRQSEASVPTFRLSMC